MEKPVVKFNYDVRRLALQYRVDIRNRTVRGFRRA